MMAMDESKTWGQHLECYQQPDSPLLSREFLERWGQTIWSPSLADKKAAAELHTQVATRVTTQPLGYLDGVESAALDSLYQLFGNTRTIQDRHYGATHFEPLTWHILNSHVRPFAAKWHRRNHAGALSALDDTDEFRTELERLRPILICFDELLVDIRDGRRPPPAAELLPGSSRLEEEMNKPLPWGIAQPRDGQDNDIIREMNVAELEAIKGRRKTYVVTAEREYATGLALSGGGIRSATFSLGVLIALARRNVLPDFDYLSTVSGGGYLGSFLTTFLSASEASPKIGLESSQLPFKKDDGEAEALRHIRHHSKYLQTSSWERIVMAASQLYGMCINGIALAMIPALFAVAEFGLRSLFAFVVSYIPFVSFVAFTPVIVAIGLPLLVRCIPKARWYADGLLAWIVALPLLILVAWWILDRLHRYIDFFGNGDHRSPGYMAVLVAAGAIPVISAAAIGALGRRHPRAQVPLAITAGCAIPVLFLGLELASYQWLSGKGADISFLTSLPVARWLLMFLILVIAFFTLYLPLDVNFTSPHRHYRRKLAEAFLIQPASGDVSEHPFDTGVAIKLSKVDPHRRAPYHLVNAALNVPSSDNPAMQGRHTDFFLFSPAFCGSPILGYRKTAEWENADPRLDLGTAMATSGAATSPLMGIETKPYLTFWLTLLNVRLGYWVKNPFRPKSRGVPGIACLIREMLGKIDEKGPYLNVTDGGHIENLGVYELLRRRCKYIVAVDGEHDPSMTFHALTTLQRLASIDLGISIEINLDDLRLRQDGLSRSHFQLCRIRYPSIGDKEDGTGYLIYVKLSLTGNEGEFIKRYRLDEPAFPHHSTANQFFSEAQFEAYRSLGEHVGDKLFMKAIVGSLAEENKISVEQWFGEAGKRMLL